MLGLYSRKAAMGLTKYCVPPLVERPFSAPEIQRRRREMDAIPFGS